MRGETAPADQQLGQFTKGAIGGTSDAAETGPQRRIGLREFLTTRRFLVLLSGTAGCWFLLDYAYYGNTISTPQIIKLISPTASATGGCSSSASS
jgi:PHS family inorganic phosphate transporter-like MFS transporter